MNVPVGVAEDAPEVIGDVGATEAAFRMNSLGFERVHRDPRSAVVGRYFRSVPLIVSEK